MNTNSCVRKILVTGDFCPHSAQGVRYLKLMRNNPSDIGTSLYIVYSLRSCPIAGWQNISIRKHNDSSLDRAVNFILGRLIFPDKYLLRTHRYKSVLVKLLKDLSSDIVIIGCTPFSLLLLASLIKRERPDVRLIVDLSDPFSFNMDIMESMIRTSIARIIERISFPYVDHIIVLNEYIRNVYARLYPLWADKFKVIEQGVDTDFIESVKTEKPTHSSTRKFTFLYAGGFYRKGRNPRELFEAFIIQGGICKLLVYGHVRSSLRSKGNASIEYHKPIDKASLASITAQADALVLMDNEYGYQVPGKTLETLASGKPVLFIYNNKESPSLTYVKEAKGVVWAKNNAAEIKTAIIRIIGGDYEEPYFDYSQYTWDNLRNKYDGLLKGTI